MKRYVFGVLLVLVATALQAQENPAPVPPNYERIDKETRRWFGEYRYRSLVRRFERGDTSLTVDHYRCLYYGAGQRGDTTYTLSACSRRTGNAGWLQQMGLVQAVWSSGNGSDTLPFHVASYADARFMRDDCGDPDVCCSLMGKPLWHGEPSNAAVLFYVGPYADYYAKRFVDYYSTMERHLLEWTRYRDGYRLRQEPQVVWPDRQQFVPSAWRYLDLRDKGLRSAYLYCPGEYNRWRNFSPMEAVRCR